MPTEKAEYLYPVPSNKCEMPDQTDRVSALLPLRTNSQTFNLALCVPWHLIPCGWCHWQLCESYSVPI